MIGVEGLLVIVGLVIVMGFRRVLPHQQGVLYTMGQYAGIKNPGWTFVLPILQQIRMIDMRLQSMDITIPEVMTRDSQRVSVKALLFYKVVEVENAMMQVENFYQALSELAGNTTKSVASDLDYRRWPVDRDLLASRIRDRVSNTCRSWGIDVDKVELHDIIVIN